jgi:hypothetical protein
MEEISISIKLTANIRRITELEMQSPWIYDEAT